MKTMSAITKALTCAVFIMALSSFAQAQAIRTWVSGLGNDANPCSLTAPCKTYAGAISKTAVHGEISTLDPGGYGAVTVTKSVTIEGTQGAGYGSMLFSQTSGVTINFDNFTAVGESQKSVRLRNLNLNGSGGADPTKFGLRGVRITGGTLATGTEVFIEDCVIDGATVNPGRGIEDTRAGGGHLFITNTTIRNMSGAGITASPSTGNNAPKVTIAGSRIHNCAFGVAFSNGIKASIYDTVITGNTTAVFTDATTGTPEIAVDHCLVSNNGTGFSASSANTFIRVSNTTAMNNTTLFTVAGGGQVLSYGNNQAGGAAFGGPANPS
jgi:nitrous oxidase accessory protein NosD